MKAWVGVSLGAFNGLAVSLPDEETLRIQAVMMKELSGCKKRVSLYMMQQSKRIPPVIIFHLLTLSVFSLPSSPTLASVPVNC